MVHIDVELTEIVNTRKGDYVVVFARKAVSLPALMQVFKYHCSSSKNYEVTFELDHGAQRISISADFLYYSTRIEHAVANIMNTHYITGVVAADIKEAQEIEQVIEKAYMWALLKE